MFHLENMLSSILDLIRKENLMMFAKLFTQINFEGNSLF